MEAQPFTIFGTSHLFTLLLIFCLAVFFPSAYKNKSDTQKEYLARLLGLSIIGLELIKPFIWNSMDYPWIRLLPIHMCSLSGFFIGVFLLTKKFKFKFNFKDKKLLFLFFINLAHIALIFVTSMVMG